MAESESVDDSLSNLMRAVLEGSIEGAIEGHPSLVRAISYIADHLHDDMTLQVISDRAYVSPSHLDRLFRRTLGLSPMRFVILLRVEKAKRLLQNLQYSVSEAGFASGFGNLRSFQRLFKKWVGCTPSAYRRRFVRRGWRRAEPKG